MKKQQRIFWRWVMVVGIPLIALAAGFFLRTLARPISPQVTENPLSEENKIVEIVASSSLPMAPALVLSDDTVEQGDALVLKVTNIASTSALRGTFMGKKLAFFPYGGGAVAMLGVSVQAKAGAYPFSVALSDNETLAKDVTVKERKFPVTELKTTPELRAEGHTPAAISTNVALENAQLGAAFISGAEPLFSSPFIYPLERIDVVGAFGNIRVSNGIAIRHVGVDLGADEGTPVRAINSGVVRFAKKLTDYGNTMLVDHGAHIFSLYLHLNTFNAVEGDTVQRGATIARSGNTGYSLTPHLHFSVNVGGVSVDGLRFIEAANRVLQEN